MSNLSEKLSKFAAAGKDLAAGIVQGASEKLDEIFPDAADDVPAEAEGPPGWRPIKNAPQHVRELAKVATGGELRSMLDLTSKPARLYAFSASPSGEVEAYYEIPRPR